jgi:pimeloyl-ACP methyl ester carboxylesterase
VNYNDVPYRFPARFVVVDGFRIAYVDVNPEAGDPVVFLHDVGGDLDDFAPCYEALSGERRVLGLDWVGFGKSDKPPLDDPVVLYTRLLDGFLATLDLERVSLVGHGLGAIVAARLATERPERVAKLVLSAPFGVREMTDDERTTAADFWSYDRVSSLKDAGRRSWYEAMTAGWNERLEAQLEVRNQLAESLGYRPWAHSVEEAFASTLAHPIARRLGRIDAPTLVVWGADDRVVAFSAAAEARDAVPGARLVAIEECGHLPTYEQPDAFCGAIAAFLSAPDEASLDAAEIGPPAADLEAWPGLTPNIGRFARMLFDERERLGEDVADLSLEALAWRPAPGLPSPQQLILRTGGTPLWHLYEVLRGEPLPDDLAARFGVDPSDPEALRDAPRRAATRLVEDVASAHEQLADWLKQRTDADLNGAYTLPDGRVGTLRWILWRLVEDAARCRGEMSYAARLLAARGAGQAS